MNEQIVADRESLAKLLKAFRELPPKVKTGVRRELRTVGDDVIAAQRAILDGPLPSGVTVTGKKLGVVGKGKWAQLRRLNVYEDAQVKRPGRSTGLREGIKKGLVTRVVTGKTRQGISIRNNNKSGEMSTGWNSKRFRHPVFGGSTWVYQKGQPYFFEPVFKGRDDMIVRATNILNKAIDEA